MQKLFSLLFSLLLFSSTTLLAKLMGLRALRSPDGALVLLYGDDHQQTTTQVAIVKKILSKAGTCGKELHLLIEPPALILQKKQEEDNILSLQQHVSNLPKNVHIRSIENRKKSGGARHILNGNSLEYTEKAKTDASYKNWIAFLTQFYTCILETF